MALTEQQAQQQAIRATSYCYVLATAWEGAANGSICLERIFTRERGVEEIRMAWWKDGRIVPRPADIDAVDWVQLFSAAVAAGVFTSDEQLGMLKSLLK